MKKEHKSIFSNMKTRWISIACIALLSVVASFFTISYLTDNEVHINPVDVGKNDITVEETFTPPTPELIETFDKYVSIKNTGKIPCFVRVYLSFSNIDVAARATVSTDGGTTYYPYNKLNEHLPDDWVFIPQTADGDGAVIGGYYYYTKQLPVGASTPYLVTNFKVEFESDYIAGKVAPDGYDINVYSESIQVYDKEGVEFTGPNAYRNAWLEFLNRKSVPVEESTAAPTQAPDPTPTP